MLRRRFLTGALAISLPFLAGCSTGDAVHADNGQTNGDGQREAGPTAEAAKEELELVRVARLEPTAIEERLPCTSHVEAFHEVEVLSQTSGQVIEAHVDEGKTVRKGDVLFRLDDRESQLNLEAARTREVDAANKAKDAELALSEARNKQEEARLEAEQSKRTLERVKKSRAERLASLTELEDAQLACDKCGTALDVAKTAVEKAKLGKTLAETAVEAAKIDRQIRERLLEDFTIRAPISGVVSRTLVKGGEWVTPQKHLCTVVDDRNLVLHLNRPQQELAKLAVGQKVDVRVDAFPNTTFAGKIDLISPVVDMATGTFRARVRVEDAQHKLLPGMFCRAWIITGTSREALMLPKTAIVYETDRPYAFVVRDGKAVRIAIEPGIEVAELGAVQALNQAKTPRPDAFAPGDLVIVEGNNKLDSGREVKVVNE